MNVRKLSVNKACIFLAVLLLAAMVTVSVALYALTQDITAVWYVLLFGIFVLFCSICWMICCPGICSRNRLWKKKVFSIKLNIG